MDIGFSTYGEFGYLGGIIEMALFKQGKYYGR